MKDFVGFITSYYKIHTEESNSRNNSLIVIMEAGIEKIMEESKEESSNKESERLFS